VSGDGAAPDVGHRRPRGSDDATVNAVGKVSEALEWVERARGRLYDFHQMMGRADLLFGEASDALAAAGHHTHAELLDTEIVGRNVIIGRWTFQVVEEYEDQYYWPTRDVERSIRDDLMQGRRHVYESEMKERRRSSGRPGHESRPSR
jgi:hypothetical protein